jgi:hypothetical protein
MFEADLTKNDHKKRELIYHMNAYKFRPLGTKKALKYVLDIIENKQLYCSKHTELNDPMEGMYNQYYLFKPDFPLTEVEKKVDNLRICALSFEWNSPLMWAHYANGFNGCVLEIELPDNDDDIRKIIYSDETSIRIEEKLSPFQIAKMRLERKISVWSYEKEVRVFCKLPNYPLKTSVKRVILGLNVAQDVRSCLFQKCEKLNIALEETYPSYPIKTRGLLPKTNANLDLPDSIFPAANAYDENELGRKLSRNELTIRNRISISMKVIVRKNK